MLFFIKMYLPLLALILFIPEFSTVPLLMSVTKRIKLFEDADTTNETSVTSSGEVVIAVDYHLARGEVYFTTTVGGIGRIYRSWLRADGRVLHPLAIAEVKTSDGLAVDWVHNNLYWTDVDKKTLEVATIDSLHRRTLLNATHGLQKPRAIVVDPSKGLLFWSDWGKNARIESVGLDGRQMKTVRVTPDVAWPNGLTIDLTNLKLYILDGYLSTISSCNYDGSDFKVLARSQDNFLQAYGLTFYANTLYWDSWRSRSLHKMNTYNLRIETLLKQTGLLGVTERMMGLKAVHSSLQPELSTLVDPCKNASCSHQCLVSRDLTPTCFCPFGYILSTDGKSCVEEGYLLISWRKTIRRYDMSGNEEQSMTDDVKAVIAISYHLEKGLLFWSDVDENRIYRAPLDQLHNKTLIANSENCDGLAVDWVHNVLYWTDNHRKTLEAALLDGSKHMIIFDTDLDQPRDIALDPHSGMMFWTDWGAVAKIEQSTLDGLERKVIIDNDHIWPNGITIDIPLKKIYYVDGKLGTIYSSSYDGSDRKIIFAAPPTNSLQLFSITVINDELYCTDWNSRALLRTPKDKTTGATIIAKSSNILLRPNGVKAIHSSLQKTKADPCAEAHCRNLCLGTKFQTAHCMGEETPDDTDVNQGTSGSETIRDDIELTKTVYNDSVIVSLTRNITPPIVFIVAKCITRDGCEEDLRCNNQSIKTYEFNNENFYQITNLLPASHYEIHFILGKVAKSFNITTAVSDPPEIPKITSVEKQGQMVVIKWEPVDTCVPGFNSYSYKLFKTGVENAVDQQGSTNQTEVMFDNLEAEVSYTAHVFTHDPKHSSSITFDVHIDEPPECHSPTLLCDGNEDCPDKSDEDATLCAGIKRVTVYKKSKTDVYLRVEVKNETKKRLSKFVGSYSHGKSNTTEHIEKPAQICVMWPDSYCLHISSLQPNRIYDFKISAGLTGGKVGDQFTVSTITKEEVSGPPEDVQVNNHNATCIVLQWHAPNQSNGLIKSFIINIDEIETFEEEKCCQSFPILEPPASKEKSLYEIETTGLLPASSYAVSIAAKNTFLGIPATIEANTPPPPMEVIRLPKVEVSSLLPLSWQPGEEPGESSQYHNLIRSYMLLLFPPKNEPLQNNTSNGVNSAVKQLLQDKLGNRFLIIWDKQVEETAAFHTPIKVENLTPRKRYKLTWVQVSQYKNSYSIDFLVSDPFLAI